MQPAEFIVDKNETPYNLVPFSTLIKETDGEMRSLLYAAKLPADGPEGKPERYVFLKVASDIPIEFNSWNLTRDKYIMDSKDFSQLIHLGGRRSHKSKKNRRTRRRLN